MPWLSTSPSPLISLLFHYLLLVPLTAASGSSYFCSREIYNRPFIQDCFYALAALPQADPSYRYYFEQQLDTAPPESDWEGWTDDRPSFWRKKVVQVPKFWSYGKQACLGTDDTKPVNDVIKI